MTMDIIQNQRQVCIACILRGLFTPVYHNHLSFDPMLFSQQDVPLFTMDASIFYTILPAKQGARGEFHHIAGLTAQVSFVSVTLLRS